MRDIVGRRKLWFTIPCVVLVVTLVASLVFGVELDINLRGGSLVGLNRLPRMLFGGPNAPISTAATSTIVILPSKIAAKVVGVIFNFLMGVTASRLMLKSISKYKAFRKPWLFGGEKGSLKQLLLQLLPWT